MRTYRHLLLVDIYSGGLSFYLAKDVRDLTSIDFASLVLLKKVSVDGLCKFNLLADDELFGKIFAQSLRSFDLEQYSVVFLVAPEYSPLEKSALQAHAPIWRKVSLVERPFFYNFYLMQKRNFSKTKLIVNLFVDCAELSLFDQDKLLVQERVFLRNLASESKHFLSRAQHQHQFAPADCFYLFSNNLSAKVDAISLAKHLKLEAIEITNLC